jgi:2-keto-4-pentenoate hydratase/2-oxohepta-3-ene-1,7-dioic acid hydratase in catechol pathway
LDSAPGLAAWLVTAGEIRDAGNLDLSIAVNGENPAASSNRYAILDLPG